MIGGCNMTISAKVIADSVNGYTGKRLVTMELYYPRFIHAEFMTHRVFSRNASSSRAIPFKRLLREIRKNPAMPVHWGANQPGMQASIELTGWRRKAAKALWIGAMYGATTIASLGARVGLHKQVVNRIVEPWAHIRVVVTSTEWSNFYALRRHEDAQPEIRALADAMWEAMERSKPRPCYVGDLHLPYITDEEMRTIDHRTGAVDQAIVREDLIRLSVARCARVSYNLHNGRAPAKDQDLALYERLVGSAPLHASPAEHQATPMQTKGRSGNFQDWKQWRKTLPNESQ